MMKWAAETEVIFVQFDDGIDTGFPAKEKGTAHAVPFLT